MIEVYKEFELSIVKIKNVQINTVKKDVANVAESIKLKFAYHLLIIKNRYDVCKRATTSQLGVDPNLQNDLT